MSRQSHHKIRNAIIHRINTERIKLETLKDMAHELFPYGHDEEKSLASQAVRAIFDLLEMKLRLMWIPFETTTFCDGIVTGTHESTPLFRNAITLGLFWNLH